MISSGIVNSRYLLMVPSLQASENGVDKVLPEHSSLYPCSSPAAPHFIPTNFQISVAGSPLFTTPLNSLDEYLENDVFSFNSINGNLSTGLTSNTITRENWMEANNYLCFDLSRRLPSEDSLPKSIAVSFSNTYNKDIKMTCFIVYEKQTSIDVETGRLLA